MWCACVSFIACWSLWLHNRSDVENGHETSQRQHQHQDQTLAQLPINRVPHHAMAMKISMIMHAKLTLALLYGTFDINHALL